MNIVYTGTRKEECLKKDRREYMREYKKNLSRTTVDLTAYERQKLDEITKEQNITIIGWIREQIDEGYKKLNSEIKNENID